MKKLKKIIKQLLSEGLAPARIAAGLTAGVAWGVFPIYLPTSLACVITATAARLNLPIVLASHYAMSLVKPFLIIPFLRMGEFVFRDQPMSINLTELARRFAADPTGTLSEFGWSFVHAATGWLILLPIIWLLIYTVSLSIIKTFKPEQMSVTNEMVSS